MQTPHHTTQDTNSANAERSAHREKLWQAIAPPLYRTSETSRFPDMLVKAIAAHDIASTTGIGFVGPAGTCKTRAAFVLLRRFHDAGREVFAITAPDLATTAADQFDNSIIREFSLGPTRKVSDVAKRTLARCKAVPVLFIDDLGKGKMTERAEIELFNVLESRTSNMLPTLWTSNAGSSELAAMISPDRRDPILRRLVEFSAIVSTGGRP